MTAVNFKRLKELKRKEGHRGGKRSSQNDAEAGPGRSDRCVSLIQLATPPTHRETKPNGKKGGSLKKKERGDNRKKNPKARGTSIAYREKARVIG